ncbi:UNVERIFIED_CONTAM: hypothetical protein GTU68_052329 [Idotea baltica]|nr:hypothetical protein [Idotea baltica]
MSELESTQIRILDSPLSVDECYQYVNAPNCGGINVFVGTVRDRTKGKKVVSLDFEAYVPMAISEMEKIARTMQNRWKVQRICMHHRVGLLDIAFEACRYAIDTLKETVPIWKKEIFEDGEVWVAAHP